MRAPSTQVAARSATSLTRPRARSRTTRAIKSAALYALMSTASSQAPSLLSASRGARHQLQLRQPRRLRLRHHRRLLQRRHLVHRHPQLLATRKLPLRRIARVASRARSVANLPALALRTASLWMLKAMGSHREDIQSTCVSDKVHANAS